MKKMKMKYVGYGYIDGRWICGCYYNRSLRSIEYNRNFKNRRQW